MHILWVEVENIKRFEHGRFEFGLGTNAIMGPNGVGKSTIVESIGYAMFDYLPYKKADFVRRGAKVGLVRVAFESSLDQRVYTIVRNTGTQYHVYDPATKTRLAEKTEDVLAWLCRHLGLEPGTDLPEFFRSTVGVPQGTLTAAFLESATRRKGVFDQILRVQAYREAADRLLETTRYLQGAVVDAERDLAGFEGRLARVPDLEAQLEQLQTEHEGMRQRHEAAQRELLGWQAQLANCDQALETLQALQQQEVQLATRHDFHERERDAARRRRDEAEAAHAEHQQLASSVQAFEEAERELAKLELERARRDPLNELRTKVVRRLDEATMGLAALDGQLAQLDRDRREHEALAPRVQLQETQEALVASLKQQLGERRTVETRWARTREELASWSQRLEAVKRELAELANLEEAPLRVRALQAQLEGHERALKELQEQELARRELIQRQKWADEARQRLERQVAERRQSIASQEALLPLASTKSALEDEGLALREDQGRIRSELERLRQAASGFRGNLCPLLDLECPHLKDQGAEAFFRDRIPSLEARDRVLEKQLLELRIRFVKAREASERIAGLATLRQQVAEAEKEARAHLEATTTIYRELAALPDPLPARVRHEKELASDRLALQQAQAEEARYAQRGMLVSQAEALEREQAERLKSQAQDEATMERWAQLDDQASQAEVTLAELGDPRTRSQVLARALEQRPRLEQERESQASSLASATHELDELEAQLRPFHDLEPRLAEAARGRSAHEAAYRQSLAIAVLAAEREARREASAHAEAALEAARQELVRCQSERERQAAAYDAEAHASLKETVERVKAEGIRRGEALEMLAKQLAGLHEELNTLARVQVERKATIAQRDRLQRQVAFVEFARSTLKEAGPHVTEAYLASISLEADRMFREITGMHQVHLRWSQDYEILLEEHGRERPFQSLSGGEQMAAALAVRLALLKETSRIDVAFFDEPTTNMDEDRRANLATQIGQVRSFRQLFVITHDDAFEPWIDHVLRP